MSSESEGHVEEVSLYFVLFGSLLALVIIGSKLLHDRPRLSSFVSEASLTLLIGISAGMLVHLIFFRERPDDVDFDDAGEDAEAKVVASSLLTFSDNVFFMALLPPILFNSGYQIRRELFYRHIKAILTFACIGTAISAITTAFMLQGVSLLGWMGEDSNLNTFKPSLLELLTFGSLISATDTVSVLAVFQSKQVDPHLFYLVYGESALNDGVALVLFKTFAGSVNAEGSMARRVTNCLMDVTVEAIGSPALGVVFGFGTALLFKHLDFRSTPMLELPLYIVLLMYVPFITAECLNLSGIVAILFSGISARRYISPNVSVETARNAEVIFKMAAYIAETCIFLELGLSVFGLARSFKWKFIAWSFLASMIGRALAIFPLTWLLNLSLRCSPPTTTRDEEDESSIVTAVSTMLASEWITPTRRLDKKISCNFATVLWFAGMRGAVAYACAKEFPAVFGHNDEFVAATMVIVLFTIIVMGGLLGPLLDYMGIQTGIDFEEYMKVWHKKRSLEGRFHRFEQRYIYRTVVRDCSGDSSNASSEEDQASSSHKDAFEYVAQDSVAIHGKEFA